jgi:hypothetical protein
MTKKRSKPSKGLSEPEAAYRHREEEGLTEAEWEAWEERNKEALVASLREAEAQIARGEGRPLDEVMAEMKARAAERVRRRKAQPK